MENSGEFSFDSSSLLLDIPEEEIELENFDPTPYIFILKDPMGKRLILPPEILSNAKVICPSFHILLDHAIAVLWCFYSKEGQHKLGTAQLHWAVKFLEGIKDRFNRYPKDVEMAIEDLEDAIVDISENIDDETVLNRNYDDHGESKYDLSQSTHKSADYKAFEGDLLERRQEADATMMTKMVKPLGSPSHSINYMLGSHPEVLEDLINSTIRPDGCSETEFRTAIGDSSEAIQDDEGAEGTAPETMNTALDENVLSWRNEQILKIIEQLQQLKNLDDVLKDLKCQGDPEAMNKLKDLVNQAGAKD